MVQKVGRQAKGAGRLVQHDGKKDQHGERAVALAHGSAQRHAVHGSVHNHAHQRAL